jgi:hypothetical protein
MDAREEELDDVRILERLRLKNLAGKKNLIEDLKKRKSQRSISLLVEVLQDESWFLREQAVQALAEAGPEAAAPVLELVRGGLWYSRAAAARVLGKMGESDAVDPLIDCLMDSNRTLQGAAATALVEIVRKSSAERLVASLHVRSTDEKDKVISCLRLLDSELAADVTGALDRRLASAGSDGDIEVEKPREETGGAREGDERA